jgi:site-specific DNA-cytosine methylase
VIAIDFFAGGGGAALGLARAGIEHAACVDFDAAADATWRRVAG